MPYPHEDNDDFEDQEPFDYDYYGPNSDWHHSGFGGHGFDDADSSNPPSFKTPEPPEYKLADWQRDDPFNYDKIMEVLVSICLNRNKRMLRKFGESAGAEKHLQALEADLEVGNAKLMNAVIDGKMRTCVYDFDPFTGGYILSEDN